MALEVKKRYPVPHATRPHHKLPQRVMKREQRKESARRMLTSVMVIAVLAVGAGIAYTWYVGKNQTAVANQPVPVRTTRAIIKPQKVPSDARVGAAVQTITPEVKPGENVSLTVRTNPEAECSIAVRYNNVSAVDSGLVTKIADEYGVVSWSWTISPSAATGKWPADATCKNKKHSAMVRGEFTIKP